MSVVVLALDDQDSTVAIGPVGKPESIDRIREEIEARGWTACGEARRLSVADWRAELKAERQGGGEPS